MKLTRKSYNRRVFTFGIVMFLAIALISTGFAAFIMSNDATSNQSGNINVGTITDGSIQFKDVAFKDASKDFYFEPDASDSEGHVVYKDGNSENLSITVTGKVTPKEYVDKITIKMTSLPAGIKAAATAGYIVLPECHENEITIPHTEVDTDASFEYTISFAWGSKFTLPGQSAGINPSIFLDADTANNGSPYTYAEKKQILIDFRRTMYEMTDTSTYSDDYVMAYQPGVGNSDASLKYEFDLKAYAKI